jgi:hypothetical protein
VCRHWLWQVSQGPGRYARNDKYLNFPTPRSTQQRAVAILQQELWSVVGGKGRMVVERAANGKENEVVVCDGKGPCSRISILCSRCRRRPLTLQPLPVWQCPAALEQPREMEVCLIGRRHSNVSCQETPPARNETFTYSSSISSRSRRRCCAAKITRERSPTYDFTVVYHGITDGSP